jgi:hypothetical protein
VSAGSRLVIENAGSGRGAAAPGCRATIVVSDLSHLCSAQWASREICRALGFDEAGVYGAVIAVTEFAHKELIDPARRGKLHLAAIEKNGRLALEARTELEPAAECA